MFGGYAPGPPYHYLDSSEKYDPILGSWTTTAAKLPQPMGGLRATNIDARVLIFGTDILFNILTVKNISGGSHGYTFDTILEYEPEEDSIRTVGQMTEARSFHAISVVRAADFYHWCH